MSITNIGSIAKPSPITGGWLHSDPKVRIRMIKDIIKSSRNSRNSVNGVVDPSTWDPVITAVKETIEKSVQLSIQFKSMFDEIPFSHRYDPIGEAYDYVDYMELLDHFNYLLKFAPHYGTMGIVALPFTIVLEWPMATHGGLSAFLDGHLNLGLRDVLNKWGEFLKTSDSAVNIINNGPETSWLSVGAKAKMMSRDHGGIINPNYNVKTFEELYECPKPGDSNLGFDSWDKFFVRGFKNYPNAGNPRPVQLSNGSISYDRNTIKADNATVVVGCESAPYAVRQKVKAYEKFWIKGQPYSLMHMLGVTEQEAKAYEGGTVYQSFLSPLTYHRWHAPINGSITKIRVIQGSYFSVSPINSFPDPETFANTQSQPYLSAVATRVLFYIKNDVVGEMVMMPIGMVEVSTCEVKKEITDVMKHPENQGVVDETTWVPKDPTKPYEVVKGDEIGTFRFGGSTHCMIFDKNVKLKFWQQATPLDTEEDYFIPINAVVADCSKVA